MSNKNSDTKAYALIALLSLSIFSFLLWLNYIKTAPSEIEGWVYMLPGINAVFNTLTAIFLVIGYMKIKKKNVEAHVKCMAGALSCSAFFLVGYILYHNLHGETKFLTQGPIRTFYFFSLISHIALSFVQVPLIFATLYHAFKGNKEKHKKVARWALPIWLYVSVTGVVVFIVLKGFNTPALS